jgi:membrane protease YdiL (CAAX protease family)
MPPEFSVRWRRVVAYASLGVVLVVIVGLPMIDARDAPTTDLGGFGLLQIFSGQIALAAFLAVWFCLQQRDDLRTFLALPVRPWWPRVRRGVRVGFSGWIVTLAAMSLLTAIAGLAGLQPREGFTDVIRWLATRPFAFRLALVAAAMTVEEAFFRAFLQRRIGLLAATACFAISHMNYGSPAMGGGVFVIGALLGLAFRRERDLAVCVVGHGTFDAIQLLVVLPLIATRV